jgi:hypothetical protein
MKRLLWKWMLLCIFSATTLSFGQNATTSLRGSIKDPTGAYVPEAKVTLLAPATGDTLSTTSNKAGFYAFESLFPARYIITVKISGFADQAKTAELLVNQPATIDFTLSIQASTTTVDVSAEAQTLNTTDASLGNSVDNEVIESLPSETRNVPDLLALQPGVLYLPVSGNSDSRSGSVNGGRSDQGNITIDGLDDNEPVGGFAFDPVLRETQDSIQEFRVSTGNTGSEFGRSSGAQIAMVTKSGTNKFHGAAYEYNRPTFTVANDWFNKQDELNEGRANIPGKLIRNIFGVSLGGPIIKNKLFFFANYEGTRMAENAEVTQETPTASYDQGILTYPNAAGTASYGITPAELKTLDAGCSGTYGVCASGVTPYNFNGYYTNGPGVNQAALSYLNSMPAANSFTEGDLYNSGSYSFSSPNPQRLNTLIAKLDYVPSDKHRIFVRGNLQDDATSATEYFPGQGPSSHNVSDNKGISAGDTWTIKENLVNDARFGFTRQGIGDTGVGSGDYVTLRFLSTPTSESRTIDEFRPVTNIVDNLTWNKGKHLVQVGGNWRQVRQNSTTNSGAFDSASSNPTYMYSSSTYDPGAYDGTSTTNSNSLTYLLGSSFPNVTSGFQTSYYEALNNILGGIGQDSQVSNYNVTSPTTATLMPDGTFITRNFRANEYEWYMQDAWRVRPNLTVTYGVRHTLLQTPWEIHGQQESPIIDSGQNNAPTTSSMHDMYQAREAAAQEGLVYEPYISFAPAGPYYKKPGFWPKAKDNFSPRLAVVYALNSKTSIRAGAGMYYDHFGEALVQTFNSKGEFGLSSTATSTSGYYSLEGISAGESGAPRFTGIHNLPPVPASVLYGTGGSQQTNVTFPYQPSVTGLATNWGLDDRIKTPYSETFDLSVQRELPGGFIVEAAYVGRMGRHLFQNLDMAEPVDYVDPQGGGDYFTAGAQLSAEVDANNNVQMATVAPIPYFENVFSYLKGYVNKLFPNGGESATQLIYSNEWQPSHLSGYAHAGLKDIDIDCTLNYPNAACPSYKQARFWQGQFGSMHALSSIGNSSYNAGQLTLRHPSSHGLLFDISYTFSHSIDMGSDDEAMNAGSGTEFSTIINTWNPKLNKATSDFDTRHMITGDWVYQLPVGRGKAYLGNITRPLNALAGGWQLSGIAHWTSGLPFSLNDDGYVTNKNNEASAVITGPIKMRRHLNAQGEPEFFDNPSAITTGFSTNGSPVRTSRPGEAGNRNYFRGDGYFDVDSGLSKNWKIAKYGVLKFSWEVYNVTNTVRFDPASIEGNPTSTTLGVASSEMSAPRRLQFALRFDF